MSSRGDRRADGRTGTRELKKRSLRLGIDVGGTFTDLVLIDGRCSIIEYSDLPESLARQTDEQGQHERRPDDHGVGGQSTAIRPPPRTTSPS